MSKSEDVRKVEVTSPNVARVEFRGLHLTIPRDQAEWSLDLLEALEDGRNIGVLRAALGPVQWRSVRALNLKAPDVDELAAAIADSLGFKSVGESAASSD